MLAAAQLVIAFASKPTPILPDTSSLFTELLNPHHENYVKLSKRPSLSVGAPATDCNADSWVQHQGAAGTGCIRGDPFSFFTRMGTDPSKVIIEFEGGGACFNYETCALPTCTTKVGATTESLAKLGGFHDHCDPQNPLASWSHVFIPYCTGDAFTGSNDMKYGLMGDVGGSHLGFVNFKSVLNWLTTTQPFGPSVTDVWITGDSAGAIATYALSPYIIQAYPNARVVHWADSFLPIFGKKGWNDALQNWRMGSVWAPWLGITSEMLVWSEDAFSNIMARTISYYPTVPFASYWTYTDAVQPLFYGLTKAPTMCIIRGLVPLDGSKNVSNAGCTKYYRPQWLRQADNYMTRMPQLVSNYGLFKGTPMYDSLDGGHVISMDATFYTETAKSNASLTSVHWVAGPLSGDGEATSLYQPSQVN